jgi:flagellar export protein FliJ
MKRFDFPLERVRRWRREQASLEELKLRQFRVEVSDLQSAQDQLAAERSRCEQQLFSQLYVDPSQLETLDSYRLSVRAKISGLENRERHCQAKVAEQLERVIEARRKFKLLDCLRENALAEWQAAANKEQEELAAELFLAKSRRRG